MFINRPEIKTEGNLDIEVDVTTAEPRLKEIGCDANKISSFASAGSADIHTYRRNKVPAGFVRLSEWMETRGILRNEED
jgi:hypothetical protein